MKTQNLFLAALTLAASAPLLAEAQTTLYEFDLSSGAFPAGTETENVWNLTLDQSLYKHGYTDKGWTVDRIDNKGYSALSPTCTIEEAACENVLRLPPVEIEKGSYLHWSSRAVFNHFVEAYRVEAYPEDGSEPTILYETEKAPWTWNVHEVSLDHLAGKRVRIVFTCTSLRGYMLALSDIEITDMPFEEPTDIPDEETTTDFTRALVVDEGTGMWCVNCPAGEITLNRLRETYGDRLIILSTHVNDVLANAPYWGELKWYSVPRMMLNRIQATAAESDKNFGGYYSDEASFAISSSLPEPQEGEDLKIQAKIKVAEEIDNSTDRYRVGFVLTGDFHRADNPRFNQRNGCTQPIYGAYYFLPSTIPAWMMHYENATLTSETAFTGIEHSLPARLTPGEIYEVEWSCTRPELLAEGEKAGVVAMVLDTETGEIMNAARGGEWPLWGVENHVASSKLDTLITGGGDGTIHTSLQPGEEYVLEVYSSDGTLLKSAAGIARGGDSFTLPSVEGIVVVRLSGGRAAQTVKIMR